MPKISIIIPVYNVEKYLKECLDSVCAQTFTDWECICVDDGSTDSSPKILDEYAIKDSRFRIIHREHSNAGACRNTGMDVAKGEYYSFLDSDDVFAPKMLEFHLKTIVKNEADISVCKMIRYRDGEELPSLASKTTKKFESYYDTPAQSIDIYEKWNGRAWDKLFKAKLISEYSIRFQEIRSTNDMRFTYTALSLSKKVVCIDSVLIAHRLNPTSLEATRSKGALCMIDALKSYCDEMKCRGIFEKYPNLFHNYRRWIVNIMFWYMDTIDTVDSYEMVHNAFYELCVYFDLYRLIEADFIGKVDLYCRFNKIRNGCTPMDSLRFHEQLLMDQMKRLWQLINDIYETKDYRLGHYLLRLPRLLNKLTAFIK